MEVEVAKKPGTLSLAAVAASIDRTAAAMSQWAERMSESSSDVKDLEASFACPIVISNSSGPGATATVNQKLKFPLSVSLFFYPVWLVRNTGK